MNLWKPTWESCERFSHRLKLGSGFDGVEEWSRWSEEVYNSLFNYFSHVFCIPANGKTKQTTSRNQFRKTFLICFWGMKIAVWLNFFSHSPFMFHRDTLRQWMLYYCTIWHRTDFWDWRSLIKTVIIIKPLSESSFILITSWAVYIFDKTYSSVANCFHFSLVFNL